MGDREIHIGPCMQKERKVRKKKNRRKKKERRDYIRLDEIK
jgi:hypothetical protein